MAASMDIEKAAVYKGVHMSGEGTMRWDSGGGYSTSVDIETPQIEESEVVREKIINESWGFFAERSRLARCKW
jgi:hypothetical protein